MAGSGQDEVLEPRRVRQFAHFFKRYMSISSVVAAALPIPVTAVGLIPTFSAQTSYLATYTAMFCFLCLGFIFYSRHQLAPQMFGEFGRARYARAAPSDGQLKRTALRVAIESAARGLRMLANVSSRMFVPILPFLLILGALYCSLKYHALLAEAVTYLRQDLPEALSTEAILEGTPFDQIPFSTQLALHYIGIFITAESAFIVMAIKEYLQDLIGLSDLTIITGEPEPGVEPSPGVEAYLEYRYGRGEAGAQTAQGPDQESPL